MLTISKPLGARQAQAYHREEFQNARENYYTEGDRVLGEWHGKLVEEWGLSGEVGEEHFARLAQGQHPLTGEQLVRHQTPHEYVGPDGERVKTMEHRAGWDATFSAPKSVSLTALVGGDARVREAHRRSVAAALDELERYVQARIGGNHPAVGTGRWVAAKFEHDSSRPVDGYAAPQLHTHVVVFNLTQLEDGEARALQPRELFRTQQYATAVYRSELALRLRDLGYEVERGESGQPEVKGYSREYLEASSPRRRQIKEHLAEAGRSGAGAAQIAAHQTREEKSASLTHEEMRAKHRELALVFGDQAEAAVRAAGERGERVEAGEAAGQQKAQSAVSFSRDRNLEREAVADERELLRDALSRSIGEATLREVREEIEKRLRSGELVELGRRSEEVGRAFTTAEMIRRERDTIERMRAGQARHAALVDAGIRRETAEKHQRLNEGQRRAVEQVLASRDQITALEGVAGAGKTTSLAAIREAAERAGYRVEGMAPTSRAAQKLGEAGIESGTMQRHLTRGELGSEEEKRLYILDESSLASTKQMNEFLRRLREEDRVLLVGDARQHQAVEAGRPYEQLQEAGMQTARLDEIVRQRDPALKAVVEQLSRGEVKEAVQGLDQQGRVHEIADRGQRLDAIAREYVAKPEGTLVVSPDNASRMEINGLIHRALQETGQVKGEEHHLRVLVARQEITGADRQWAERYQPGDVVRYTKGSEAIGVGTGEYVRVDRVDAKQNLLTVEREGGERVSYDPRRLHGVALYREAERGFAEGDRVQFTAPYKEQRIANRELGTIEEIDRAGNLRIRLESGREARFNITECPHLDHGYAVTSHSSQGQTADRVLVHVDTERTEQLVNRRLAYVAVSRGRYDAQVFTNDKARLTEKLGRDASHRSAIQPAQAVKPAPSLEMSQIRGPLRGPGIRH
jgi:conjugative relaxase-like TrwC/TraI family protein